MLTVSSPSIGGGVHQIFVPVPNDESCYYQRVHDGDNRLHKKKKLTVHLCCSDHRRNVSVRYESCYYYCSYFCYYHICYDPYSLFDPIYYPKSFVRLPVNVLPIQYRYHYSVHFSFLRPFSPRWMDQ